MKVEEWIKKVGELVEKIWKWVEEGVEEWVEEVIAVAWGGVGVGEGGGESGWRKLRKTGSGPAVKC